MADTETVYILEDVVPYFETIIENQNTEIERLETVGERLNEQIAYQQEQNNGLSYIGSHLNTGISVCVVCILFFVVWKVINNWFFKSM